MARIGALEIDLIAETASFNANIKKASANLNSEAAKMNRSLASINTGIKSIVAAGAALGAVAIGREISRIADAGLKYATNIGDLSRQLGVTTQDLQVYRYAATQVGIAQSDMDAGLGKLTRTLGDAQNGSAAAGKVFAALGVELKNANGSFRTASEVMPFIADALAKIPDPARRASVEVQLFGKAGQKLDGLLSGGSDAINNLRNAAQSLGYVLSNEQIQKADQTAIKLNQIKAVLDARIAGVVSDNAGAILDLADAFMAAGNAAGFVVKQMVDLNRGSQLYMAENGRLAMNAKLITDPEEIRKYGRVARFRDWLDAPAADQAKPSNAPSGDGLGQFLAPNAKTPKATKDKIVRTWMDDFRDMSYDMLRQIGNEQNMGDLNPLDTKPGHKIDAFLKEGETARARLEEWEVANKKYLESLKINWSDAANSVLYSLRDMTNGLRSGDFLGALQGVLNLFTQLGSYGVFGKSLASSINYGRGFAGGGYTGSMGTSEVAGVVHGQEYVFDAKAVQRIGVENLEKLRSGAGFMRGGYTGGPARAMAGLTQATRVEIVPNKYFDAVVEQGAAKVAAPMAVASGLESSRLTQQAIARRSRNRIP